jgi:hypothetical protein
MTLHPILALDHVIDEYRDYLRTEFRAKDPGLREALEQALDQPLFLAQEPFFQAHRPFRSGKRWRELPIDPKLAQVMEERSRSERAYLHQSEAIDALLAPTAQPVVVTTGTGSGKTEAFLLPVLQNAIEDAVRFKHNGLTAILVYPMNALANDQLLRLQDYLREAGFSGTVSVRRYDRSTGQTERQEMRKNPPHILLTNYMMLEYLLVRPVDREDIFATPSRACLRLPRAARKPFACGMLPCRSFSPSSPAVSRPLLACLGRRSRRYRFHPKRAIRPCPSTLALCISLTQIVCMQRSAPSQVSLARLHVRKLPGGAVSSGISTAG